MGLNHRVYPNSFSRSVNHRKEEETPKKRDALDEWLEFWRPIIQKMKEIQEILKTANELFSSYSSSSSLQQPSIITSLDQTPIIDPVIPPVTRTALQPTSLTPALAPSAQQQGQKKEKIIKLGTDLITDLFITSTFMAPEIQRRLREVGKGEEEEDSIIIPREPSLPPYMRTRTFNNNSNNKKREEENLLTENKGEEEEQQLEEDSHDIEGHPLSKNELPIDNEHDCGGDVDHVYSDYDDGRKWEKNKDTFGNVIDACKVITDPPMEAKDYLLSNKAESWKENWNKKE